MLEERGGLDLVRWGRSDTHKRVGQPGPLELGLGAAPERWVPPLEGLRTKGANGTFIGWA